MRENGKNPSDVKAHLKKKMRGRAKSIDLLDLCDASGLSPQYATALYEIVFDTIDEKIQAKGKNLITGNLDHLNLGEREYESVRGGFRLNIDPNYVFRVIMVSDTHIGSRHDNIEGLEEMFERGESIGVKIVLHSGDWTDGELRRHRDMFKYLRPGCMGFDGQYDRVAKYWPRRKGIETYGIAGNHDHFAMDSVDADILRHITLAREDIHYLKSESIKEAMSRKVNLEELNKILEAKDLGSGRAGAIRLGPDHLPPEKRNTIHLMLHPGDGSGMALSYKSQRILANIDTLLHSFEGMENPQGKRIKPHSMQIGHYHKSDFTLLRGVLVYQAGTMKFADQFHEVRNLNNMMGYWIVEYTTRKNGDVVKVNQHFQRPYIEPSRYTRTVAQMLK